MLDKAAARPGSLFYNAQVAPRKISARCSYAAHLGAGHSIAPSRALKESIESTCAKASDPTDASLDWIIVTSLIVNHVQEALDIVRIYELKVDDRRAPQAPQDSVWDRGCSG